MQYDLTRADVLLRDLEHVGREQAPAAQLGSSSDGGPAVTGTCTRLGLLRMGVRLARAALTAKARVVIYENGAVGADGSGVGGVVQVFLADDPPAEPARPSGWWWVWVAAQLAVASLCVIGVVTVTRWLVAR